MVFLNCNFKINSIFILQNFPDDGILNIFSAVPFFKFHFALNVCVACALVIPKITHGCLGFDITVPKRYSGAFCSFPIGNKHYFMVKKLKISICFIEEILEVEVHGTSTFTVASVHEVISQRFPL